MVKFEIREYSPDQKVMNFLKNMMIFKKSIFYNLFVLLSESYHNLNFENPSKNGLFMAILRFK